MIESCVALPKRNAFFSNTIIKLSQKLIAKTEETVTIMEIYVIQTFKVELKNYIL